MTEKIEVLTGDVTKSPADALICIGGTVLPGGNDTSAALLQLAGAQDAEDVQGTGVLALPGGALEAGQLIYTCGPQWQGGEKGEAAALQSCMETCLEQAAALGCRTIDLQAVPAKTCDAQLFHVATITFRGIRQFLKRHPEIQRVRVLCPEEEMVKRYSQAYNWWFATNKADRLNCEDDD